MDAGSILQGDLVALYNYMAQIIVELIKLASLIITINRSLACADRVADVLDLDPGMSYKEGFTEKESGYAVEFDDVSFAYDSQSAETVSDIDFKVKKGQTVGIIGGTGSGKSTIVSLIYRAYDVSAGSVKVNGNDVRDYPKDELLKRIGIVPQQAVLFAGSIRDNLLWGNEDADDETLWKAIDTAQAHEVVADKEGGLDHTVEQGGRNFSGGQRQRLTIARALVRDPEILILDDSASALDLATDYRLRQAIGKLPMTVFIVSQRCSSVRSANLILVMDDGRLAGQGTHEKLLKENRVYQEIYYSQYPDQRPEEVSA